MSMQQTGFSNITPVSPYLSPAFGGLRERAHQGRADALLQHLSNREREILPLLAARWTDQEIADALCISYRTVTTHVAHIFDKLGINSRRAVAPLVQDWAQ